MSFLSGLVKIVLDWAYGKLADWISGLVRFFQRKKVIENEEQGSVEPLKKAKTAKEIDDAADSALGGF